MGQEISLEDINYNPNDLTVVSLMIGKMSSKDTVLHKGRYYPVIAWPSVGPCSSWYVHIPSFLTQFTNSLKLQSPFQGRWQCSHLCCWFTSHCFVIGLPWSGVTNLRGTAVCVCASVCVCVYRFALTVNRLSPSFNWSHFSRTNGALERGEIVVIVPWEEERKSRDPKKRKKKKERQGYRER